jgi:hypothetical protein
MRVSCTTSASCPTGYCVNGQCYPSAGTCQLPVP